MDFVTCFYCTNEMLNDISFMQSLVKSKFASYANTIRPYKAVRGSGVVDINNYADDFITNRVTITLKFKASKAPRIAFKNNRKFRSRNPAH